VLRLICSWIWLRSKWAAGRARLRPSLIDRGADSKAARTEPRAPIFHASILSSVICYLSCASRLTSVAWGKELFKPASSRIICREMEMHQIRYFLAVSEYLNFRRAAEECHVSRGENNEKPGCREPSMN
jgi:hypothetical protein